MKTVSFKSYPEFWEKEKSGLKNNTLRKIEERDTRFDLLNEFAAGTLPELRIEVINTDTKKSFFRKLKDVTVFGELYIITWEVLQRAGSILCFNSDCKHYFEDSCLEEMARKHINISSNGSCDTFEAGTNEAYKEILEDVE